MEVALAVRRMLQQLAVVVPVALRRFDLRRRLEIQDPLLAACIRVEAPGRPDRQDQVVARAIGDRAEDRVADPGPFVDEQHLVGDTVAIEPALRHRSGRPDDAEDDVAVEVQRHPAGDRVAARLEPAGLRQAVAVEPVIGRLELDARARLDPMRLGRRDQVVQERAAAAEALDAEQLLGIERPVGRPVLGMALARHRPTLDVIHRATGLLASWREEASLGPRPVAPLRTGQPLATAIRATARSPKTTLWRA